MSDLVQNDARHPHLKFPISFWSVVRGPLIHGTGFYAERFKPDSNHRVAAMHKLLLSLVLSCLTATSVLAQLTERKDPPARETVAPQQQADPTAGKKGPWSAEKLMDTSIRSPEGDELGEIEDLLVDDNGKIVSVVVETDSFLGMGGKRVLLPFEDLELTRDDVGKVLLKSNDKSKIEKAPEYKYED